MTFLVPDLYFSHTATLKFIQPKRYSESFPLTQRGTETGLAEIRHSISNLLKGYAKLRKLKPVPQRDVPTRELGNKVIRLTH